MKELQIERNIGNKKTMITLTDDELEKAYRIMERRYLNEDFARKVLEKILDVSIREVSMPATQKTINMLYDGKGIRLDVYINDDEGTV